MILAEELKLALAMAGVSGCRILPQTKAVPYVRAPEEMVVGKPLVYSSALTRAGQEVRGFELDRAASAVLRDAGYAEGILHRTRHSLG